MCAFFLASLLFRPLEAFVGLCIAWSTSATTCVRIHSKTHRPGGASPAPTNSRQARARSMRGRRKPGAFATNASSDMCDER